jgi:hypothetical protein
MDNQCHGRREIFATAWLCTSVSLHLLPFLLLFAHTGATDMIADCNLYTVICITVVTLAFLAGISLTSAFTSEFSFFTALAARMFAPSCSALLLSLAISLPPLRLYGVTVVTSDFTTIFDVFFELMIALSQSVVRLLTLFVAPREMIKRQG